MKNMLNITVFSYIIRKKVLEDVMEKNIVAIIEIGSNNTKTHVKILLQLNLKRIIN